MATAKISISVPEALVKALDREAKKKKISRSQMVTQILISKLYVPCPTCGNVHDAEEG